MRDLFGYLVVGIVPMLVGILAVILPFRSYRKTRKNAALTVGIVNSVFCGASVVALAGAVLFGWGFSTPLYAILATGFIAMIIVARPTRAKK